MVPLLVKSTSGYPAVVHCSTLYKCSQIPSTPSSKTNCTFYSSTHLMRQMIHITTAKHAIDCNSLPKPNLFQKEAVAFYIPSSLALIIGKETDCMWYSLIIIYWNKQASLLPPSCPSLKPFTPSITLIRLIKPLAGADMSLGVSQWGKINGLHQRAGAPHKPAHHWPLEINLIFLNISNGIIHYCSLPPCISMWGAF